MSDERRDAVRQSDDFDRRVGDVDVATAIDHLMAGARRMRSIVRLLIVIIVCQFALGCAVGVVAVQARSAARDAASLRRDIKNNCLTANVSRAGQLMLWEYIFNLTAQAQADHPERAEPEDRQRTEQAKAFIRSLFGLRDCEREAREGIAPPTLPPTTTTTTRRP